MWVKAWRRANSPKPVRTLPPLRDLFASWVADVGKRLSGFNGGAGIKVAMRLFPLLHFSKLHVGDIRAQFVSIEQ